jgi:signal transduction histidine kinase
VISTGSLVALLLLVQTGLILLLLLGRRKRSRLVQELHQLSGRLITAQEDERKRIARELHDDVTQLLALHSIELDQFSPHGVSPEDRTHFRDLSAKAAEIATEVHNIAHRLHPSKLNHLGLLPAVRELCRDVTLRHGIDVEVADENMPPELESDLTLCLYRVIQESLGNVLRHSGASHALVSLKRREREITLKIADDGHGFDPETTPASNGIGLFSMRERLRLVRGHMNVCSQPGAGTEITVTVPAHIARGA